MVWLQMLPSSVGYLVFHWQFFRCVESVLKLRPLSKWHMGLTFLLNYGVFVLCSMLNLHLIHNWIMFLILLLGEQMLLYRQPGRRCAVFALAGTQLGLAVNILCRSLLAILMDVSLVAFDNSVQDPGNMKALPVIAGFFVTGLAFWLARRFDLLRRFHLAMEDRGTLLFLLGLLVAMYCYLCMNLTVYYIEENNLVLKLWSMKSSIFVVLGQSLAMILSIRLGQIAVYRAKSQESREQMAEERARERKLRAIAAIDPLTGCMNRFQAGPRLGEALETGRSFCVCFVDMDRLKAVNDAYGHEMGDRYIQAVSGVLGRACGQDDLLFRYGGDEFLLLLYDTAEDEAYERLRRARQELEEEGRRSRFPFSASISYGAAGQDEGEDGPTLVAAADERMYRMKKGICKRQF